MQIPTWAETAMDWSRVSRVETGIVCGAIQKSASSDFHDQLAKGPALRELQKTELTLAWWERPMYERLLTRWLADVPRDSVVVDWGCGDGRFVELLCRLDFTKIIAVEPHFGALNSLRNWAFESGNERKVAFVHSDIGGAPLTPGCADLALALGVLYYTNQEFESNLSAVVRSVKPGGNFIDSQPSLAGAATLALLYEGVDELITTISKCSWPERNGEKLSRFRAFGESEIEALYESAGLTELNRQSLSLLPILLRIEMVRGRISADELLARKDEIVDALYRCETETESAGLIARKHKRAEK